MPRTLYLVAYDVCDPKRLSRVGRYFHGYRVAGQKSVPEIWVTPTELQRIRADMGQLLDAQAGNGALLAEVRAHHWVPRSPDSPTGDAAEVAALSHRELEVLRLVADGLSNKEIGVALTITEGTVKNHVHNALNKLGMDNRIQAAAYIVRHGLGTHRPKRAPIRQD